MRFSLFKIEGAKRREAVIYLCFVVEIHFTGINTVYVYICCAAVAHNAVFHHEIICTGLRNNKINS